MWFKYVKLFLERINIFFAYVGTDMDICHKHIHFSYLLTITNLEVLQNLPFFFFLALPHVMMLFPHHILGVLL